MSQNRSQRPGSSQEPPELLDDAQPQMAPRAAGLFGADRFARVEGDRTEAASQIGRTLKAWRKASGASEGAADIPTGGGQPLSSDVRQRMEPKLGGDLSGVKIHTGGASSQAASQLGARAFTVGSDVHFNAGEHAPGTKEGDRLLAHELTHVVQGQKSGIQRKEDGGGKGGQEVSQPEEPAEIEADAKGDEVAGELHNGTASEDKPPKGEKGEKKDGGKHAKEEANAPDGGKEEEKGEEPKEAASEAPAAKLFRKIYLGGRQAKPKPQKPLPTVDPKLREEMEAIKAYIEQAASKTKALWSAAAVPVGTILVAAGKGAAVGTGAGPVGTAIGAAAGAVVGALVSIFGIGGHKHAVMEQKAALLDNIDLLVHQPDVIHELYDYCRALSPPIKVLEEKAEAAVAEMSNKKKKLAEKDKKAQDKKAPKGGGGHSTADKVGHAAHKGHTVAEVGEAGLETGAAAAEAGAHGASEAIKPILEAAGPVLEGAAHVAQGAGALVGAVVAGVDFKTFSDKSKKYDAIKKKIDKGT